MRTRLLALLLCGVPLWAVQIQVVDHEPGVVSEKADERHEVLQCVPDSYVMGSKGRTTHYLIKVSGLTMADCRKLVLYRQGRPGDKWQFRLDELTAAQQLAVETNRVIEIPWDHPNPALSARQRFQNQRTQERAARRVTP